MQRGEGGVERTEGQNPNYDSARFTKACNTNELRCHKPHRTDYIAIYAFAYNVQYADSLYFRIYAMIYSVV